MSAVTGPNNYLPGQRLQPSVGQMCDNHHDRLAIVRIVGETDSFGSEMSDFCQECLEAIEANKEESAGTCDICHCSADRLRPKRDPEEGSQGPVYLMCDPCIGSIVHGTCSNVTIAETDLHDVDIDFHTDEDEDDYRCVIPGEDTPTILDFHTPDRW